MAKEFENGEIYEEKASLIRFHIARIELLDPQGQDMSRFVEKIGFQMRLEEVKLQGQRNNIEQKQLALLNRDWPDEGTTGKLNEQMKALFSKNRQLDEVEREEKIKVLTKEKEKSLKRDWSYDTLSAKIFLLNKELIPLTNPKKDFCQDELAGQAHELTASNLADLVTVINQHSSKLHIEGKESLKEKAKEITAASKIHTFLGKLYIAKASQKFSPALRK